MRHIDKDFHIYADGIQLYVSFDLSNPNEWNKLSICIR